MWGPDLKLSLWQLPAPLQKTGLKQPGCARPGQEPTYHTKGQGLCLPLGLLSAHHNEAGTPGAGWVSA